MTMILTLPDTDRERSLDERIADACGHLNACHSALVDLVAMPGTAGEFDLSSSGSPGAPACRAGTPVR